MQNSESILSLRDILRIIFKRQRLIITVTIAALFISTVVSFLMPPTFESTAQILVRRSILETEEPQIGTDLRGAPTSYRQVAQADEMNTATSILRSRDLVIAAMERLALTQDQFYRVRDFRRYVRNTYLWGRETASYIWNEAKHITGLSRRPTPEEVKLLKRERFIDLLAKAVIVEQVPDSDVLRVGLRVSDPELAKKFAGVFSELALSWYSEKFRQIGNFNFFSQQAQKAGTDLKKLEQELTTTRQKLKIISFDSQRQHIIGNRYQLQANLDEIHARLAGYKAGIAKINDIIKAEPQMTLVSREREVNPVRDQIAQKITELELNRIDNAGKLSAQSRVLSDIDLTLKGWKKNLHRISPTRESVRIEGANNVRLALQQKLVQIQADMATIEAEAVEIEQSIRNHDRELEALNNGAYQVVNLERQVKTQAAVYEQYLKNAELARIAEAKQQARLANLNIVQSAPLPIKASKPRKLMIILLAGASGLLIGLAWGFATEMNDTTFDSEAEVRHNLKIELLGTISYHGPATFRQPSFKHEGMRGDIENLFSKILRTHSLSPQPIGFVSSRNGEGNTTIMLQTALAATSDSQQIILIDAAQDATLSQWFGCEQRTGGYDFQDVTLLDEILQPTGYTGISLLPIALEMEKINWPQLFALLKERGDMVFIDCGSMDKNPASTQLLPLIKEVVLIIAAHTTRREIVQQTIFQLHEYPNANLLGAVLNRRRFFIPEFIYRLT